MTDCVIQSAAVLMSFIAAGLVRVARISCDRRVTKIMSKVIWQKAASPTRHSTPRGGESIRPLRALGRHSRPRWAQCNHA